MSFVVDSSVSLSWCFADERSDATDTLLQRVVDDGAVAPSLWPLEVLNVLVMAERRKRINAERRQRLAGFLRDLPISIDDATNGQAWQITAQLAAQLSVYDAAYLDLAQRLGLPLATLDKPLRVAADALGVRLLGTAQDEVRRP